MVRPDQGNFASLGFLRSDPGERLCRPWFGPRFSDTLHRDFGLENNQPQGARVMEGSHDSQFFLKPQQAFHRQYEALRAVFVEDPPIEQVAQRFGYTIPSLRSMLSRFRAGRRRGVTPPFFSQTGAVGPAGHPRAEAGRARNRPKSPTPGS